MLEDGLIPAELAVKGYFKQSTITGGRDKLYLSLIYERVRLVGLDDNGPSRHRNSVGKGLPYYQQLANHPHVHILCEDGLQGYAEPIEVLTQKEQWAMFLSMCNISAGPDLQLPIVQLDLI